MSFFELHWSISITIYLFQINYVSELTDKNYNYIESKTGDFIFFDTEFNWAQLVQPIRSGLRSNANQKDSAPGCGRGSALSGFFFHGIREKKNETTWKLADEFYHELDALLIHWTMI